MKKTLIAAAVMAASGVAFAASNVTLYGVIEEGVVLEKAKHGDTLVKLQSGFDHLGLFFHRQIGKFAQRPLLGADVRRRV